MKLRVLGCHGSVTSFHRVSGFLINQDLALDGGSLASSLTLMEQGHLRYLILSHTHIDHIRDIALVADNLIGIFEEPLIIYSTAGSAETLKSHLFNDKISPDFFRLPTPHRAVLRMEVLEPDRWSPVGAYRVKPIPVPHTVEAVSFLVSDGEKTVAYTGDTGPGPDPWRHFAREDDLRLVVSEVSFPNRFQSLADAIGHLTPASLEAGIEIFGRRDVPILLFHIKPAYEDEVRRELEGSVVLRRYRTRLATLGEELVV